MTYSALTLPELIVRRDEIFRQIAEKGKEMNATRETLPPRRPSITTEVKWSGEKFILTIGFDLTGHPREVFADGFKEGSTMRHLLADACIIISIALQCGVSIASLTHSMGTIPEWAGPDSEIEVPASPIGAILEALQAESART